MREVNMVRVHERGSVVGYVVVGIVLTALVVGGVYFVKHQLQGQLAAKPSATVATTTKDQAAPTPESQKSDTSASNSDNKANTGDKNTSTASGSTDQQAQSSSNKNTTTPAPAPSTSSTPNSTSTTATGSNLPQTGPVSAVGTAAILAMLFGAYTAYRRSLKV